MKPKVLVFIPNYLPGYKSGGILRTVVNTVDWLRSDYEFWIVTRDRDLGSKEPYPEIDINNWQPVNGAMVRYLAPTKTNISNLVELIIGTPHDVIYLNSFFDSVFTIKVLLARRLRLLPLKPLVLAPRGEFVEGPLSLKYTKKIIYIKLSKFLGFYRNVTWHASSKFELQDFVKVIRANPSNIRIALDLPSKITSEVSDNNLFENDRLRIVFISRLTREKNLDYALNILRNVRSEVLFDIYGPDEDPMYWKECQKLIMKLPSNIGATYHGAALPSDVAEIFGRYDLFFFPSMGENYGHVIAESISVGTKVLISNNTPWLELEADGLGWDIDLNHESVFINTIEKMANESLDSRLRARDVVKKSALKRLLDPRVVSDNRALFET